jgi:hypothetical protein
LALGSRKNFIGEIAPGYYWLQTNESVFEPVSEAKKRAIREYFGEDAFGRNTSPFGNMFAPSGNLNSNEPSSGLLSDTGDCISIAGRIRLPKQFLKVLPIKSFSIPSTSGTMVGPPKDLALQGKNLLNRRNKSRHCINLC